MLECAGEQLMAWIKFFFSFSGRFNRAKFWLCYATGVLGPSPFVVLFLFLGSRRGHPITQFTDTADVGLATGIIGSMLIGLAACFAATVKRLHDRDKSGGLAVVYYVLPSFLDAVAESQGGLDTGTGIVLELVNLGLAIWIVTDLGILRGDDLKNKYGPDPLGPDGDSLPWKRKAAAL